MTQCWTGKHLYLVQIWDDIITGLYYYPWKSDEYPINTAWVENSRTNITNQITIKTSRSGKIFIGEERLGFSHKEVVNHSLWSGFAMDIFLDRVYTETIIIIGRWYRNAILRYIWIQVSDLRKTISDLMDGDKAF